MNIVVMDKLSTCRCCLRELAIDEELHEFSSEVATDAAEIVNPQNFIKISDCYSEITSMNVAEQDEDITKICSSCLGDLKFCFLFKKKCIESAKIFEQTHNFEILDAPMKVEEEAFEYVVEELVESQNGDTDEDTDQDIEETKPQISHKPREKVKTIEPEFACDQCPKTFDRKEYYRRHYQRAHAGKGSPSKKTNIFQCDICGKISTSREEHHAHEQEHEDETRFKCRKCGLTFLSSEDTSNHFLTAHSDEEKPFNCETCSKTFKNRYQLVLHNRSHTGEKPFQCPVCDRAFSMSSNLQKHLDTHSTDKPYQCSYCDQFFKTQRSLKFHTVCYHQPDVKVKCQLCEKSFVNKSYLKVHMLYHTGEKNFTCTICGSKYYKSSHLKRHIQNVHFKLRLMKCDYCSSDFVRKETYKAHIISHHKQHLSTQEFEDVLENIRKFQAPHLDINQFTVEKQATKEDDSELLEEDAEMEEMIEDETGEEYEMFESVEQ